MSTTRANQLQAVDGRGFDHTIIDSEGQDVARVIAFNAESWKLARIMAVSPALVELLRTLRDVLPANHPSIEAIDRLLHSID